MTHDTKKEPGLVDLTSDEGYERLARLYRYAQVGRCVSSVTHDLNNFLGAIMAYAELIGMDIPLEGEPARMLNEIVDGVKKSSSLVNDLTAIARKERRDISLVGAKRMAERVLNLRRYDFRVAGIELEEKLDSAAGDLIVDRPRIEQAIIYVLNNSLEAVLGTEAARVTITVTGEGDRVTFAVKNSGPAIPGDIANAMFDPFFSTKEQEHLGLGLTVARSTAEYHEGTLTYSPETGFVFELPRKNHLALEVT